MKFLNWELLTSPYNWIIIWVMVLFGLMLLALVAPQQESA